MTEAATQHLGQGIDYAVILLYFGFVVAFGMYFSRYTHSTKDFFFGGQRFAWWLIAFSGIATTVGSYSFVKYSDVGFKYGLSSTQTYLNDWFWMPILLLVWLPIIYYQRVTSVPEYFERRFGRPSRVAATLIVLTYLVAYIGVNLFTLGQVLESLLGWDVMLGAFVTAVAVTLYVVAGGQTSVIMTDLAQGIILLIVGLGVLFAGVYHFGGFGDFWALLPETHKYAFSELTAPPKFSGLGIYMQDGVINTGAFVLMNQGMIMRFLSLKSVKDAQKMAVCWILILAPLAAIATGGGGWIAKALVNNGDLPDTLASKEAFIRAAHFLCAPGIFGFVLAALTAALMSTADTLINAVSAIFVNDVWKPFVKPGAEDRELLGVARITSVAAAGVGLAFVLVYVAAYDSIYQAHALVTASIPAPMVVAVLLGVLWKRFTPAACFATLVGGSAAMGLSFVWPDALVGPFSFGMGPDSYKFMRALYGLTVCGALGIGVSLFTKPKTAAELVGLVTGTELDAMRQFKGGEVNRRPGGKARLRLAVRADLDTEGALAPTAIVPQMALDTMAANPGDLLYVCDTRWWFGGLRSVHVKAGDVGEEGVVIISPAALEVAHLNDGQDVLVEKIM